MQATPRFMFTSIGECSAQFRKKFQSMSNLVLLPGSLQAPAVLHALQFPDHFLQVCWCVLWEWKDCFCVWLMCVNPTIQVHVQGLLFTPTQYVTSCTSGVIYNIQDPMNAIHACMHLKHWSGPECIRIDTNQSQSSPASWPCPSDSLLSEVAEQGEVNHWNSLPWQMQIVYTRHECLSAIVAYVPSSWSSYPELRTCHVHCKLDCFFCTQPEPEVHLVRKAVW